MLDAANMIKTIEHNRDMVICSPEKISYENGWMSKEELEMAAEKLSKNSYGMYLKKILKL